MDMTIIALTNAPSVDSYASKMARLVANMAKLALFTSDYLDYRFLGDRRPEKDSKWNEAVDDGPASPATV